MNPANDQNNAVMFWDNEMENSLFFPLEMQQQSEIRAILENFDVL
jgi:hypothetical protein